MITPFQKLVIKLLVSIYNNTRDERSGALFVDSYGQVYDQKTTEHWGGGKEPWEA